jgi:hypothetical protein
MRAAGNAAGASAKVTPPSARAALAGLHPGQMAFLGEYSSVAQDKQVFVQVLCWPTIPAAWSMLAQSHAGLRNHRGGMTALPAPKGSSWIHRVAPQLSQPLERDAAAAESTLATLIRRLPIRFAASVVQVAPTQAQASDTLRYRDLFSESLAAYGSHLKGANQAACRVLIAPGQETPEADMRCQVYGEVLPHLDNATHVNGMALIGWQESDMPLPLEMAQLVAFAVGKHLHEPELASPLFETVRGHLVPSLRFPLNDSPRRRR